MLSIEPRAALTSLIPVPAVHGAADPYQRPDPRRTAMLQRSMLLFEHSFPTLGVCFKSCVNCSA